MKSILLLIATTVFTSPVFADSTDFDKYFCQSYSRKSGKIFQRSIVLTPMGAGKEKLDENGEYLGYEAPYLLEIYKGAARSPEKSIKGSVLTEDVHFFFTAEDEKTTFNIYLDELEESSLSFVEGKKRTSYDYICRF